MSEPTDPIPAPSNDPTASAPLPVESESGLQPPVAAGLACIFLLLGGIVFLILEKKDKFVRFYAMQSVFVGGAALALSIFLQIAGMILLLIPILGRIVLFLLGIGSRIAGLALLVVWIVMIVKAFTNKEWEVPFFGPLARRQLEKGRTGPA